MPLNIVPARHYPPPPSTKEFAFSPSPSVLLHLLILRVVSLLALAAPGFSALLRSAASILARPARPPEMKNILRSRSAPLVGLSAPFRPFGVSRSLPSPRKSAGQSNRGFGRLLLLLSSSNIFIVDYTDDNNTATTHSSGELYLPPVVSPPLFPAWSAVSAPLPRRLHRACKQNSNDE